MTALDTIKSAILGNPLDPNKRPSRQGVVRAFSEMQAQLEAAQAGALAFATVEQLPTGAVPSANIMAWVMTGAGSGIYRNTGTTLSASWTRVGDIPVFFILGMNTGEGTVDDIQVTTDLPVPTQDGRALIGIQIIGPNTASPPTVTINDEAPLPIVTASGNNVVPGGLTAGFAVGFKSDNKFQLLSDQATIALIAQMEDTLNSAVSDFTEQTQETRNQTQQFANNAAASATEAEVYASMVGAAVYDFSFDSDPELPGYDWSE